jgi:hypothetical protein
MRCFAALAALAAVAVMLVVPVGTLAAQSPVDDCNVHAALTRHYTVVELRNALTTMPPTVKEYTNCFDLINHALLAQIGTPGGGSAGKSSGGSFLPVWLIVILGLLIVGGGGYALLAFRRQGAGDEAPPPPPTSTP